MEEDKMKEWIDSLSDQELVHCVRAAGLADTEQVRAEELERAARFVGSHIRRKPRIIAWASASVLAIAAGLAAIFISIRPHQTMQSGQIAEAGINSETEVMVQDSDSEVATVSPITQPETVRKAEKTNDLVLEAGKEAANYAAKTEVRDFSPIKPDKEEYRIRVVNEDKSFTFRWDASELSSLVLILQDSEGTILDKQQFSGAEHYDFPAKTGVQYHAIHWRMNVQYKDGAEGTKCGIIYFDKVKE